MRVVLHESDSDPGSNCCLLLVDKHLRLADQDHVLPDERALLLAESG